MEEGVARYIQWYNENIPTSKPKGNQQA